MKISLADDLTQLFPGTVVVQDKKRGQIYTIFEISNVRVFLEMVNIHLLAKHGKYGLVHQYWVLKGGAWVLTDV